MEKQSNMFQIYAMAWVSAMRTAAKAVASKPVLPALENILVSIKGCEMQVEASDTETTICVQRELIQGGYEGRFLVPAKFASGPLSELGSTIVQFSVNEGSCLTASWAGGMVRIPIFDTTDWPKNEPTKALHSASMNSDDLQKAIAMTDYAMAKDETRPVINSLLFDFLGSDSGCNVVATDAHRLVKTAVEKGSSDVAFQVVVPRHTVQVMKSLLAAGEAVSIHADDKKVTFVLREDGALSVSGRLLEGKYPAWQSVMPMSWEHEAEIRVSDLMPAIGRAAACIENNGHFRLSFSPGGFLVLSAQDLGYQTYGEMEIPCTHNFFESFDFGVRAAFLADVITKTPGDVLKFGFGEPTKAMVVLDTNEDLAVRVKSLVTPVLL